MSNVSSGSPQSVSSDSGPLGQSDSPARAGSAAAPGSEPVSPEADPARGQTHGTDSAPQSAGGLNEASVGQLMSQLSDQLSRLVRDELQLMRVELAKSAKRAGLGTGLFGAAGVLAVFGLAGLIATAMIAVALLVPWWLSALIITVAVFLVAGVLALVGKKQVAKAPAPAEHVVASVKADVDTVKEAPGHGHTNRS